MLWTNDLAPAEAFALEDGKLRQLTHHNDDLMAHLQLGITRDFQAVTGDGVEVHGLLMVPSGYVNGHRLPTILLIHGGPNNQDAHGFDQDRQFFAGHGYAVLNVNYRGSVGRDTAFQQSIFGDWGNKEVVDLLARVEEAISQNVADPEALGVAGWSYGATLTDYLIASTTRFKAAVSGAGLANPLGFYGVDQYVFQLDNELGPPWERPDLYIKLGYPLLHANRIQTPTLFMNGEGDFNTPVNGSEQMYEALRSLQVPSELVIYPNQFHALSRSSFNRDHYQRELDWFDKYVLRKRRPREI